MADKIISKKVNGETIVTNVDFDFDGKKVSVEIHHFHPKTLEDITNAIANRRASELAKLQAEETNNLLIDLIDLI